MQSTALHSPTAIASPGSPQLPSAGFDWREYYFAIRSRAWIVLLCLIAALLFGMFSVITQHGLYKARSVLFIEQAKSKVMNMKVEEIRDDQIRSIDMINTLVDLIRSRPFALRVTKRLQLEKDREFLAAAGLSGSGSTPDRVAGRLMKMVTPVYRPNTRLIDIFVTTRSPSISVMLANAYAEEYITYIRDQKGEATRSAISLLMDESDRLRRKMRASEEGMQSFRERERAASMEAMLSESQGQITELSNRQHLLQSKLTQLRNDLDAAALSRGNTEELLRLPSVAGDVKVASLVGDLSSLEKQFVLIKQRYRAKHPLYISTKTQIDLGKAELNKVLSDVVGLLESLRGSLEAQSSSAKGERENAERRLLDVTGKSIEYNDLKRELESDSLLYNAVLSRIKEVDVSKDLAGSPIQIQEKASGALPVGKSPLKIILQALILGLATGLGIVIGLHKLDSSVKTVEQLEQITGLSVVASIPRSGGAASGKFGFLSKEQAEQLRSACADALSILRSDKTPFGKRLSNIHDALRPAIALLAHPQMAPSLPEGGQLVVQNDRKGAVAESFRSLRTSFSRNASAGNQRSFLITSAYPGEGKSFCSVNFSTTLAQQGFKTLLIDADLRKPSLSKILFGEERKPGLSDVLGGTATLPEAANTCVVEGLHLLAAGSQASNPSELLAGDPFRKLLGEALLGYDRIVIDSPPILAVSDTLLIAPEVDAICMVVRSFMTPARILTRALKSLGDTHLTPPSLIFNCVPLGNSSFDSYSYPGGHHFSYGNKGVYGG